MAFRRASDFDYFRSLSSSLESKRNMLCDALDDAGLSTIRPQGGYFVLADTSNIPVGACERRDDAVNQWLTEHVGITGIPTSYFFSDHNRELSDKILRFAYCKTDEEISRATLLLKNFKQ